MYGGPHIALALLWMELQGMDVGCRMERIAWVWMGLDGEKRGLRCAATLTYSSSCILSGRVYGRLALLMNNIHTSMDACVCVWLG